MKKIRMILLSLLAIVLCVCLIVGATFAIFTSKRETNITISSGKVKVTASIGNIKTYSYVEQSDGSYKQGPIGDKYFATGGHATFANNELQISDIVPGDKVEFDILIANQSNVDVKYQVQVMPADIEEQKENSNFSEDLYNALDVGEVMADGEQARLINDLETPNLQLTKWKKLYKDVHETALTLSVELPYDFNDHITDEDRANGYQDTAQGKNVTRLNITVMAVQGNAHTEDPGAKTVWPGYSTGSDTGATSERKDFEYTPNVYSSTWGQIQSDIKEGLEDFVIQDGDGNDISKDPDLFTSGTWDTNVSYLITNGTDTFALDNLTDPNDSNKKLNDDDAPIGTTYSVTAVLSNVNTDKYQFASANTAKEHSVNAYGIMLLDAAVESTSGEEVALEGIALIKVKTVLHIDANDFNSIPTNPTYYTIEDALNKFDAGTIIVGSDTYFATPEIAKIAGYLDKEGNPVENHYNVRGTLLVPYGTSCAGFSAVARDGLNTSISSAASLTAINTVTRDLANPSRNGGFATLTLSNGINLTVTGTLTVNAVMNVTGSSTAMGGANMYINGANYGEMIIEEGATVTLESGSTFNSMGYTRGDGKIIVKSGAEVYEPLNATGFRGRDASIKASENAFPFNQFTLTSIACEMTINYGAKYSAKAYVYFPVMTYHYAYGGTAQLAGKDNKSFIQLEEGATLTKCIEESTGKITFAMNGNISVNNLDIAEFNLSTFGNLRMKTSGNQIPLAGHFKIDIQSGTTTIPKGVPKENTDDVELKLLPGAELVVEKGATLKVEGAIYSYGKSNVTLEGARYSQFYDGGLDYPNYPIAATADSYRFAPTSWYTAETPAKVTVAGTLIVAKDATMGCEVSGEDGGKLTIDSNAKMNGSFKEDDSNVSTAGYYKVTLTGRGVNANEKTSPLSTGDWEYNNGRWVGSYYEVVYEALGDDMTPGVLSGNSSDLYAPGALTVDIINATTSDPTRDYHKFIGWYYDEECKQPVDGSSETFKAGDVVTIYAGWEAIVYTVELKVTYSGRAQDFAGNVQMPSGTVTWSYGHSIELLQPQWNSEELAFSGWKTNSDNLGDAISSIGKENIKDLDVDGEIIHLYGFFTFENEVTVVFNVNAPQYTQDELDKGPEYNGGQGYAAKYHWTKAANDAYNVSIGSVDGQAAGYNLDKGIISKATEQLEEIQTTPKIGVDDNGGSILEYYFIGWRIKDADGEYVKDEAGNDYFIKDGDVIDKSWVNNRRLELEGVWKQKSSLILAVKSSSASLTITIGATTVTLNGGNNHNTAVYYYAEGTKITIGGSGTSDYFDVFGVDKTNIPNTGSGKMPSGSFIMPGIKPATPSGGPYAHTGNGSVTTKVNAYNDEADPKMYADVVIRFNGKSSLTCIAEGTLVMLPDGTQKPIEDLQPGDKVLVFNHETGMYEAGTMWFIDDMYMAAQEYRIINLEFSDGTVFRISYQHALFDLDLNKYVFINEANMNEFIGHRFVNVSNENGEYINGETVLVQAYVTEENIRVFGPISEYHFNLVTDGLLTMPSFNFDVQGMINIFEYGEGLMYDEAKMQADIEKYGVFTYEEFADLLPYEVWEKAPIAYFKVAIGKGILTWEEIEMTIEYLFDSGYFN